MKKKRQNFIEIHFAVFFFKKKFPLFPLLGVVQPHKWENCMTLDRESWGYRRTAAYSDYLTPEELVQTVVETVSCGGKDVTQKYIYIN